MSIRANKNTKDQLSKFGAPILVTEEQSTIPQTIGDDLCFNTLHLKKPCFVDLAVFRDGQQKRAKNGGIWDGPFQGRAMLIEELAPAFYDQVAHLAESTVVKRLTSLRKWWRIFDAIEAADASIPVISSTAQLSEVHRQFAIDSGISGDHFTTIVRLINTTRLALKLRPLHWIPPEHDGDVHRHLAPLWQIRFIRHKLKHRWLAVLDRWTVADELRKRGTPLIGEDVAPEAYAEQTRLLRNYQRLGKR